MKKQLEKGDQPGKAESEKDREYVALRNRLLALNAAFEAARAGEAGEELAMAGTLLFRTRQ